MTTREKPGTTPSAERRGAWRVWCAALLWAALVCPLCFWGLPSRANDDLLFGGKPPWDASRFAADSALRELRDRQAGADTDVDPLGRRDVIVDLTADGAARAAILLRYRLYSHQPDEMITFRALQRMKPRAGDFDPKLYQYGGAYIYGVGGLVGAASLAGAARLTRDVDHYIESPADFGRFYLLARLMSVTFGLVGIVACFHIAARLGGRGAGWLAMLVVGLSPVFLSGCVEAKPHLPSACMALVAIERALHYRDRRTMSGAVVIGLCAGLSAALVLTGMAALLVLPAVWLAAETRRGAGMRRLLVAAAVALGVYAVTNPYVLINLIANPESLRSNLGNSTAMYEISRIGEGAVRVSELLAEAAGGWMLLVGVAGCLLVVSRLKSRSLPVVLPAIAMILLCVAIGAGKPAEFARFLVLPVAVLGCGAAVCLRRFCDSRLGLAATLGIILLWGLGVSRYPRSFLADGLADDSTRREAGRWIAARLQPGETVGVFQEPAPYSIPPLDFASRSVSLLPEYPPATTMPTEPREPDWIVLTVDDMNGIERYRSWLSRYDVAWMTAAALDSPTPITWANKPVVILRRRG